MKQNLLAKFSPFNFLMLLVAGIINAIGVTLFIAPVQLYDSGISGTSILLSQLTPDYLSLSFFLVLLNVPLLFWATEVTGDEKYRRVALTHTKTSMSNLVRPDHSTYHTYFFDPETGAPVRGATCQGYKDDSCWARGQAWGVYGTAISYRYTKRPEYLEAFRRVLSYYLDRLPEDLIPYWDMTFTEGDTEPRDSSSASIVACGLLEAAKYANPDQAAEYTLLAAQMLGSVAEHYAVRQGPQGIGLVRHGTYSKKSPYNTCTPEGVDECVSWGDYFYMEGLTRLTKDWTLYW